MNLTLSIMSGTGTLHSQHHQVEAPHDDAGHHTTVTAGVKLPHIKTANVQTVSTAATTTAATARQPGPAGHAPLSTQRRRERDAKLGNSILGPDASLEELLDVVQTYKDRYRQSEAAVGVLSRVRRKQHAQQIASRGRVARIVDSQSALVKHIEIAESRLQKVQAERDRAVVQQRELREKIIERKADALNMSDIADKTAEEIADMQHQVQELEELQRDLLANK
jgi:chromosome segregation ATPase